ncbi:MAG: biopolymer transporter ExbD [Planctomycetes bacterium]|nr:biopolymer transporter ExbD [Planctomycetota bacterium]
MRLPGFHRNDRGRLDVKMTPMIDVVFLLLIFFVCTASFYAVEQILPADVSLSGTTVSDEAVPPELRDVEPIIIEILWQNGEARWRIDLRRYERLEDVRRALAASVALHPNLPVILDVEGAVPMENVIDVYDLCRQVGLREIQFAASVDA